MYRSLLLAFGRLQIRAEEQNLCWGFTSPSPIVMRLMLSSVPFLGWCFFFSCFARFFLGWLLLLLLET